MTLRSLQIFAAVAECRNMTKAADKLYISQPSVSMTISDIEREYDITLFERMSGKLVLTETGRALLRYARQILDAEQAAERFLREESSTYCIRIGVTITIGASMFSSIIAEMKQGMPRVDYHVTVANTHIIEEMLVDGEIDIALVEGDVKNSNLEIEPLIYDRLVVISSNEHHFGKRESVRLAELADAPLIMREEQSGSREFFERTMRARGLDFTVRWSSYSYSAIIDAVEHDLGVSVISYMLAKKSAAGGRLHICEIEDACLERSFKLVYKKNKYISDIILKFSEICERVKFFEDAPEKKAM